jgi:hypothetical protein
MHRTILLAGVLPFVSAFLGGVLAFSLVTAPQATAQSSQLQEVQASAVTIVSPDGTVLARLGAGSLGGGNLTLFDPEGTRGLALAGGSEGSIMAYGPDGSTITFRAGKSSGGTAQIPVKWGAARSGRVSEHASLGSEP